MTEEQLFRNPTKVLFKEYVDTGGMFDEVFQVAFDDDETQLKRYFASRQGGFGGGSGRRHATFEEAMEWIERQM
jgi:hypothetical protein